MVGQEESKGTMSIKYIQVNVKVFQIGKEWNKMYFVPFDFDTWIIVVGHENFLWTTKSIDVACQNFMRS